MKERNRLKSYEIQRIFRSDALNYFGPDYVPDSLHGLYMFKQIEQNTIVFYKNFDSQVDCVFPDGPCGTTGSSLVDKIRKEPFDVLPNILVDFSLLFSVEFLLPNTTSYQIRSEKPKTPSSSTSTFKSQPALFHFAECTNCRHLLPLSTTTESTSQ